MISDPTRLQSADASGGRPIPYTPCEQCGAALDRQQRYCLSCGTRRKHVYDPASRFLAGATRRQKPAVTSVPPSRSGGTISVLTLVAVLLIPVALGLGVLVGRSSPNADSKQLAAALRAPAASAGTGSGATSGAGAAASSASQSGTSTSSKLAVGNWTRSSGYTVQLSTLPHGTTPAAAARLEQADRQKGAPSVGILASSAYKVTPAPAGAYVIYTGSYASAAEASKALTGLRSKFPAAHVIHVTTAPAVSNTPVVSHTNYGSAHQVVGYKASNSDLAKGAQVAAQDAHSTGKRASGRACPTWCRSHDRVDQHPGAGAVALGSHLTPLYRRCARAGSEPPGRTRQADYALHDPAVGAGRAVLRDGDS